MDCVISGLFDGQEAEGVADGVTRDDKSGVSVCITVDVKLPAFDSDTTAVLLLLADANTLVVG